MLPPRTMFTTSGTTGRPVEWWRTREQLLAEATMLVEILEVDKADVVVTAAPQHHLYGFLAGNLVPALADLPVTRWNPTEPFPAAGRRPLVVTVPASWWALARCSSSLSTLEHLALVHSTAYLPPVATQVCRALPEVTLTELHGSTETGLVGVRRARGSAVGDARRPFELAADVSLAPEMPVDRLARLAVVSPRLASSGARSASDHHELDDLVEVTGPRSYRMTGSRTRLVKVNGRRIDLDAVENTLRAAVPGAELDCVLVREEVRGEWYDVVVTDASHQQRVAVAARRALAPADAPRTVRLASVRPAGGRDLPLTGVTP
ncbi:hypothetical protein ACWD69_24975 [Micromonospora chokoriensis]